MNWPPLPLLDGDTLVVSPSQLSLLQRCHRHWGYKYLYRRELAARSVSAAAGKAFHAAVEAWQRVGRIAGSEQALVEGRDKLVKGFEGVEVPEDDYRTLGRYQKVLDAYTAHYRDEPMTTLGNEIPVTVPLGEVEAKSGTPVKVLIKGIVDRLVRWPDGTVMVGDTKTTKDWRESHQKMWERASAPKAYCWGLMEMARREPALKLPPRVHGFMLDSVVVRREGATLKRPRKAGIEDHEFRRALFYYSDAQLVEWRENALLWVKTMLWQLGTSGDLSFNETACSNFYGKTCPFLDVCNEADDKRALVLSFDKYKDYEPSPFERPGEAVSAEEEGE